MASATSIYDFSAPKPFGKETLHMSELKGKVVLIVNVASKSVTHFSLWRGRDITTANTGRPDAVLPRNTKASKLCTKNMPTKA
jgi:carbohydrate-binding DOMON domain-containing protein